MRGRTLQTLDDILLLELYAAPLLLQPGFFDGLAMKVFFISPSEEPWNALLPANRNSIVDRSVRACRVYHRILINAA